MIKTKTHGFTLVELAIVMMIIGLLIGGVLKGQAMVQNARLIAVMKQVNGFTAAFQAFQDKYGGALPGDMSTATMRIPSCQGGTCVDGNSNGIIGAAHAGGGSSATYLGANQIGLTDEPRQSWQHLALSDFITGVVGNSPVLAWGESHPPSTYGAGGFHIQFMSWSGGAGRGAVNGSGHYIRLQGAIDQGPLMPNGQNPLSPKEAYTLDVKFDDGQASSGFMITEDGQDGEHGCDAFYNPKITQKNCAAAFLMNK